MIVGTVSLTCNMSLDKSFLVFLYNRLGFVRWELSFSSICFVICIVIHPSKFLILEEEDDEGLHSVRRSRVPTSYIMYLDAFWHSRQCPLVASWLNLITHTLLCPITTIAQPSRRLAYNLVLSSKQLEHAGYHE
jgi:hypothetical protein